VRLFNRPQPTALDQRFNALADYNSERARGIMHTDEWKRQMSELQAEYNALLLAQYPMSANKEGAQCASE
jgi:hypothetical protein